MRKYDLEIAFLEHYLSCRFTGAVAKWLTNHPDVFLFYPEIEEKVLSCFKSGYSVEYKMTSEIGITDVRRMIKLAKKKILKPEDVIKISSDCKDPLVFFELHKGFPSLFTSDDLASKADWNKAISIMKRPYQSSRGKEIERVIKKDKKFQDAVLIHEIHNE